MFDEGGAVVRNGYAELPAQASLGVILNEKVAVVHPHEAMASLASRSSMIIQSLIHSPSGSVT
jgi:hypothetical protein